MSLIQRELSSQAGKLVGRRGATVVKPLATQVTEQVAKKAGVEGVKKVDQLALRKGVAAIESRIAAEKAAQTGGAKIAGVTLESSLPMQENMESLFRKAVGGPAKGTAVLFHGYTAGPWQFTELADKLTKEGFNVYAPRLPGHGFIAKDGMTTGEAFIKSTHRGEYDAYVAARYAEAAALGVPVVTSGLSGGADLALRMAEKYPENVKRVFAIAPFQGPLVGKSLLIKTLVFLDKVTFGGLGRVMDLIPYDKNALVKAHNPLPHTESSFGAALAIQQTAYNLSDIPAAVQFVTTEGDVLGGKSMVKRLFDRVGGAKENGWFHFTKEDGVIHAMISPKQNKVAASVEKVQSMMIEFFKTGKLNNRPPASI